MKIKQRVEFAAVDGEGTILLWSISGRSKHVRKEVGGAFCINPVKGWRDAVKAGYRIIKVMIKPVN